VSRYIQFVFAQPIGGEQVITAFPITKSWWETLVNVTNYIHWQR